MGAHPYYYFTAYLSDIEVALERLRAQEFDAGRYNPVKPFPGFPITHNARHIGRGKYASIEEAVLDAAEEGTRSILDISRISEEPTDGAAAPYDSDYLLDLFRTLQPSHEAILASLGSLLSPIERGQCLYLTVSKNGKPSELFFAGYSYD